MRFTISARFIAVSECGLFTLIAGSTFVLSKIAFAYMRPLTVIALRYFLAFLVLFPFLFYHNRLKNLSAHLARQLFFIGLSLYVVGNGALYWGLPYVQATTASLLLSFIPLLVLVGGIIWLKEIPARLQVNGIIVALIGGILFFFPGQSVGKPLGIALVAFSLIGNAAFGILGREIAREQKADTLTLTALLLAFGSGLLIPIALATEGLPRFSVIGWGIVLVLAMVNTVCAFMLYNHALQVLPAFELSAILNITPLVTAVWAWLFLNERLSIVQIIGMVIVVIGIVIVQICRKSGKAAQHRFPSTDKRHAIKRK